MNNNDSQQNNQNSLLLPQLKQDTVSVQTGSAGIWSVRSKDEYRKIATSLDLGESKRFSQDSKSITSIPNVWARALLMETALYNADYPLHDQMVEQWQGMLAAIAFAEMRQFDLKVKLLDLSKLSGSNDRFVCSLLSLLPQHTFSLYQLREQPLDKYNPWQEIYVFLWNGNPVGISTPSTLVCPVEHGHWHKLPWYQDGRLRYPEPHHLTEEERSLLWSWLDNIIKGLPEYTQAKTVSTFIRLLESFKDRLCTQPRESFELSSSDFYFEKSLDRGALKLINRPLKAIEKASSVQLIPSKERLQEMTESLNGEGISEKLLLVIDLELDEQWNKRPQEICIYKSDTLATKELRSKYKNSSGFFDDKSKITRNGKGETVVKRIEWIKAEELFLPEFYFVAKESDGLKEALRPKGYESLFYKNKAITPFLPINPKLLEYLTAEDIEKRLELKVSGDEIEVLLDLDLSGFPGIESPKSRSYSRKYTLKQENSFAEVPVLEIWPNFKASGWNQFFSFYYAHSSQTFQVVFPEIQDEIVRRVQEGAKGIDKYQINRLYKFPSYAECRLNSDETKSLGLILLPTPPLIGEFDAGTWKVGVDFGTSFTNVYVNHNGTIEPLKLKPFHLQITSSSPEEKRTGALLDFFTTHLEELLKFPMSSVLTTRINRKKRDIENEELGPYLDGCIYIPESSNSLKDKGDYIKTGLKWVTEKRLFSRLFLENLALQINALAAKRNISQIEWFISYPSSFSLIDRNTYLDNWNHITQKLSQSTGIKQICPTADNLNQWRPESVAAAQYFADYEGRNLVYSCCIDIGGGSSDISIWENNDLKHQCSIQLAGYHLFSQFLEANPKFVHDFFGAKFSDGFDLTEGKSSQYQGNNFSTSLDVLLRKESEIFLKKRDQFFSESKNKKHQALLQLMAIGTAGLYYYLGVVLKSLHNEGYYKEGKVPPVYLGGNGARLFNWLSEGGQFDHKREINRLFNKMLSKASGFPDSTLKVSSYISSNPKAEVACGLVLDDSRLTGWQDQDMINSSLVSGEFCIIDGEEKLPYSQLRQQSIGIENFEIPISFKNFKCFVNDFNDALVELENPAGIANMKFTEDDYARFHRELQALLLKQRGKGEEIRFEPPFILVLKTMLSVYAKTLGG